MAQSAPTARIPVAVLGATGMVGQRLVALLANHPWFELAGMVASERSVGRSFAEAVRWRIEGDVPEAARALPLVSLEDGPSLPVSVAFSALPAPEAERIEPEWARAGVFVSSNASA
ncbi:MAG TPA: aspartate-semialdehyde dehydrogenase, partial [Ktedonobacterales bacterium]|nr:aspartate-semialdehyde dehydrogenase [Ktedonobacterales bacterium]